MVDSLGMLYIHFNDELDDLAFQTLHLLSDLFAFVSPSAAVPVNERHGTSTTLT